MWIELGINSCEIKLPGCLKDWLLQNVHRKKRIEYLKNPEGLYDYNEVILGCQSCHFKLEGDRKLTEITFNKLRPQNNERNKINTKRNSPF